MKKRQREGGEPYYTVYDSVTDEVLAWGGGEECAAGMGWSLSRLRAVLRRNRLGLPCPYVIVVDRSGEEE